MQKKVIKKLIGLALVIWLTGISVVKAGNPDRAGQAGGTQLLLNPFARSSGINGLNVATAYGIESIINNPAGLAYTTKTEVVIVHTEYLVGSGISMNALGFSQRIGKNGGVLGLAFIATSLGNIEKTTIDKPDGGIGTFSPLLFNLNLSYAKSFVSDRIYVGLTTKVINESLSDVSSTGVAFDVGVQYKDDPGNFRVGVALRNIGPALQYSGDGLLTRATLGGSTATYDNAVATIAQPYQLPTLLYVSMAYAIGLDKPGTSKDDTTKSTTKTGKGKDKPKVYDSQHRLIPMFTFVSNSFSNDQYGLGVEYEYKTYLGARMSYLYENNIGGGNSLTVYTGFSGGVSLMLPMKKKEDKNLWEGDKRVNPPMFGIDYAYRTTRIFGGIHTIGIRMNL